LKPRRCDLSRRGFTIIELLVAIGVIAVLFSFLLPAMSRAREHTKMAKCLKNLQTLSQAVVAYCQDNVDTFPRPATAAWCAEDWVYWQSGHNVPTGQGRIAPYLHTPLATVMTCPSDDYASHLQLIGSIHYPYSYTINEYMARTQVLGHQYTLQTTQIQNPSEKIMLIDESTQTVDDGCWAPQNYSVTSANPVNLLSNRHDLATDIRTNPHAGNGNVAYADCHAAFVPRFYTTQSQFYQAYANEP